MIGGPWTPEDRDAAGREAWEAFDVPSRDRYQASFGGYVAGRWERLDEDEREHFRRVADAVLAALAPRVEHLVQDAQKRGEASGMEIAVDDPDGAAKLVVMRRLRR